jgi:CRP-like cAMP-binding protein
VLGPSANGLLERLPNDDRVRIERRADHVTLGHQVLQQADTKVRRAYFPVRGLLTVMTEFEDGRALEVATVGPEGMAGLPLFLGATVTRNSTMSQLAGESLVLDADALREELERSETFRTVMGLYSLAFIGLLAQSAACAGAHSVRQRLSRLLLTCHDASRADGFAITQEFLAGMLGVQRPGVSLVAEGLRRDGAISYRRGHIRVVERRTLESAACECYGANLAEYNRLLP